MSISTAHHLARENHRVDWNRRGCCLALAAIGLPVEAATLTVTDPGDAGSGVCATTCTLRDAIASAAPGDSIVFASGLASPITLSQGELLVYKNLQIWSGCKFARHRRQPAKPHPGSCRERHRSVSGVAMNNGKVAGVDGGFSNASRAPDGGDAYGGGVLVNAGSTLQLIACQFNGNQAAGGFGGTSTLIYSTQGNGGSAHGGAIYSAGTL